MARAVGVPSLCPCTRSVAATSSTCAHPSKLNSMSVAYCLFPCILVSWCRCSRVRSGASSSKLKLKVIWRAGARERGKRGGCYRVVMPFFAGRRVYFGFAEGFSEKDKDGLWLWAMVCGRGNGATRCVLGIEADWTTSVIHALFMTFVFVRVKSHLTAKISESLCFPGPGTAGGSSLAWC